MKKLTANDSISTWQLCVLIMLSMRIGIPNINIAYLSPYRGGFIINHMIAALLILLSLIPIMLLAARFPKRTLYEYSADLLGKPLGGLLNLLLILTFAGIGSSEMRPTINMLQTYLLPLTPSWITSLITIIAIFYILRGGINTIARTGEAFFVVSIICLSVVFFMSVPYLDLSFFGRHFTLTTTGETVSSVYDITTAFFPLGILLFFTPFSEKKKPVIPVIASVGFVLAIFLTFAAITESVFGTVLSTELFSPLIELSKLIGSDTGFFPERSNIIFMLLYKILPQFINCAVSLYISALGLVWFFPKLRIAVAGTIVCAATYITLLIPTESERIINTERFWDNFQFAFLPLALLLLALAAIERKKETELCESGNLLQ